MLRLTFGGISGGLLLACSLAIAQIAPASRSSYAEPPEAPAGDFKPAPPETIVVPGQPRHLPQSVTQATQNSYPEPATAPAETTAASANLPQQVVQPASYQTVPQPVGGSNPVPSRGVQPVQFTTPAPAVPKSSVLYPEPPTPMVKISVRGLDTAAAGQDITYRLTVINQSDARAHNVIARCPVPRGTKVVKTLPEAKGDERDLEWNLDTLEPGALRQLEVVFKPNPELTEVAIVGKVQFEHGRVVRTKLATPMLEMKKTSPAQGILNEPMTFKIVLTNPGKVPVTDLQIVDTLPDGLEYIQETSGGLAVSTVGPKPNQRNWALGTLRPKESRTIEYRVMPTKIGDKTSDVVASAIGVHEKAGCNTAVHEARIGLQVVGPTNNKGTANQSTPCLIHVHNQGTATLHNVRVICAFPSEIRLAKASSDGHLYKDAVQWVIATLEPNETKDVSLSLVAPSAGLRDLVVSARADKGLEQRQKVSIAFEGIPALNWQTVGTPAVAAPGQPITYTITVTNPGTAPAKNVQVVVDLPELVEFREAQPEFKRGQGSAAIFFNPVEVPPMQSVTLKVVVMAKKAGEARFHFEMTAEGMGAGPLKHSRITTISPNGQKEFDPTRTGQAPPMENKKPSQNVIPAGGSVPSGPPGVLQPPPPEMGKKP